MPISSSARWKRNSKGTRAASLVKEGGEPRRGGRVLRDRSGVLGEGRRRSACHRRRPSRRTPASSTKEGGVLRSRRRRFAKERNFRGKDGSVLEEGRELESNGR
jgi:hypothetical protein